LASVPFHIAYKLGLVRIYNYGDLGQTFPIARGSAPILATAIAFLLTHETPTFDEIFAILLICFGIFLVASDRANQPLSGKAFWCGIFTGLMVASYSVLNGLGVRSNGDWLGFVVWLMLLEGGLFVALVWYVRKNTLFARFKKNARNIGISGLLGTGSFMVFLWALSEGPIGSVTALRETSIIFVTIIGGLFLNEKLSFFRIFAASIVAVGVILLAFIK
jgi:drug/metabolite transporter (DMT)-like permease